MSGRRQLARGAVIVVALGVALGGALAIAQPPPPAPPPPPPRPAAPAASHFLHASHKARGVDVTRCTTCHRLDPKGQVIAPAAQGHAPCLQSGCHGELFADRSRPERAGFCLGCHQTVPEPWQKAPAKLVQAFQNAREYHVSMNHFAHANKPDPRTGKRVACVACHAVDAGYKLQPGTPGHAQCAGCHTKDVPGHTMADCGKCHAGPSRAEYFAKIAAERRIKNASRPNTTVRACEGEGVLEYTRGGKKVSCFTHERPGHRQGKDGSAVQCESCHYIVTDKTKWKGGETYESLADLHFNSVIFPAADRDPSGNTQHKACAGGGACHEHAKAVVDGSKCFLCHANKSPF